MIRFEQSVVGMRERVALVGGVVEILRSKPCVIGVQAVVHAYESGLLRPRDLKASEVR